FISISKSGLPTAKVEGKFIHSNRDPVREADRLIISEIPENISSCIVEGFGLGYYVDAILTLRPDIPIIIVEPSAERFLSALEARDLKNIFTSPMVSLLIENKSESIHQILPGLPKGSIQIFKHRALYELNREYYLEINILIQNFISRRDVNTATLKKFGKLWVRNLISNLELLPEAGDVGDLSGLFNNLPVLLLAAGPSLDKLLPLLKTLRNKFIIVAVDTSAPAVINAGVIPDFTVVVDPQYWNTRHLDRVDLSKTILISESSTHPGIFRKNHSKMFFCGSLFPLGVFMEKFGGHKKKLAAGGSVATTAWDFCRTLSSGQIFCGGLDLGFPENKTHFHGSFFEEKVHMETLRTAPPENFAYNYITSGNTVLYNNNTGSETLTDQRLSIYIKWFEEQIKINKIINIWNLSPLGVKIEGMNFKDIKNILDYPDIRNKIDSIINNIKNSSGTKMESIRIELNKGVNILENEFNRLMSLSNKAIEQIYNYKNSTKNKLIINSLIKNLDIIDKQIMGSDSSQISSFILQPIIAEIEKKTKAKTFDEEINNSEQLYNKIQDSADFHKTLVLSYLQNNQKQK
ncbi:MAG: 6-hydroxymethylpterin diphosphokinase MptE-like protein, partial [Spirochaetota bacterium]|nr:6-hydroxymethylpterin diphosphokinase MptE-like protein [Spirochaetota bacterium]